jgi:hypothetical protein
MTVTGTEYAFFVYCAAFSLLSSIIIFYLRKKEAITIVAAEDHSSFIPMKGTSPAAVLIDPRTEMDNEAGSRKRQESTGGLTPAEISTP